MHIAFLMGMSSQQRKKTLQAMTIIVAACGLLFGCAAQHQIQSVKPVHTSSVGKCSLLKAIPYTEYWPSTTCRNCHDTIFRQYSQSMHKQSFTNPVFQAQYFKELLPLAFEDKDIHAEAEKCIACHAPEAFMRYNSLITSKEEIDPLKSGVICDFCHRITGYKDESPGNGNYISSPGTAKLGPFKHEKNWHHVYSELHTKSEFCAICHNAVNHHGLEIKSTYTEWKDSRYAEEGIQCQDCHMNIQGFLTAGKPTYESGQASHAILAHSPYRSRLYTHRFPGAHSNKQVNGALTVEIEVEERNLSAGDEMRIDILVNNSRTGHKMPSGSIELRLLWLDIKAFVGDRTISVSPAGEKGYDISGEWPGDREVIVTDVPRGRRVYRTISLDKTGKQTLSSYKAVNIIFDNRLDAGEIRTESYHFTIPKDASGKLRLLALLNYLPYPGSFADKLGLPRPEAVTIAAEEKEIIIY